MSGFKPLGFFGLSAFGMVLTHEDILIRLTRKQVLPNIQGAKYMKTKRSKSSDSESLVKEVLLDFGERVQKNPIFSKSIVAGIQKLIEEGQLSENSHIESVLLGSNQKDSDK